MDEGVAMDADDLDLAVVHHKALRATQQIVAHLGDAHWDAPTPCEDWNVRELLQHVVAGNRWVKPLVDGQTIEQVGNRLDGDLLHHSPFMAYESSATEADCSFAEPGAMEAMVAVSYGPVPASVYCGHRIIDVLVHGWDLAKATGGDTTLDPELVDAAWAIIEPQYDLLAASGMFGSPVEPPADADPATRLLIALGRTP